MSAPVAVVVVRLVRCLVLMSIAAPASWSVVAESMAALRNDTAVISRTSPPRAGTSAPTDNPWLHCSTSWTPAGGPYISISQDTDLADFDADSFLLYADPVNHCDPSLSACPTTAQSVADGSLSTNQHASSVVDTTCPASLIACSNCNGNDHISCCRCARSCAGAQCWESTSLCNAPGSVGSRPHVPVGFGWCDWGLFTNQHGVEYLIGPTSGILHPSSCQLQVPAYHNDGLNVLRVDARIRSNPSTLDLVNSRNSNGCAGWDWFDPCADALHFSCPSCCPARQSYHHYRISCHHWWSCIADCCAAPSTDHCSQAQGNSGAIGESGSADPNDSLCHRISPSSVPVRSKKSTRRIRQRCVHGITQGFCMECDGTGFCEHGHRTRQCEDCRASSICVHGRPKWLCTECDGMRLYKNGRKARNGKGTCLRQMHTRKKSGIKTLCEHGRQKSRCRDCGGSSFCVHRQYKYYCKECGGNGVCHHGRRKSDCKECGGTRFCVHGRWKYNCRPCGGRRFCSHGQRRYTCNECARKVESRLAARSGVVETSVCMGP